LIKVDDAVLKKTDNEKEALHMSLSHQKYSLETSSRNNA